MEESKKKDQPGALEFATFYLGNALFGINILEIQEINKHFEMTRVPDAPDELKGILNLRGRIVTVFDLAKKLGINSVSEDKNNRNIIVDSNGEHIGLLVDSMGDVVIAKNEELEPAPANIGGVQGKCFQGVIKTDDHLIGILDIDEVLKE
jgi:purine-binding chemotaxis protein CheW